MAGLSVAHPEDKQVSQALVVRDGGQVVGDSEFITEGAPDSKDFVLGVPVLGTGGLGGDCESRAEVSCEAVADGR